MRLLYHNAAVRWIVNQAEEGDRDAVENSTEELQKIFDIESAFYLHFGHWEDGAAECCGSFCSCVRWFC